MTQIEKAKLMGSPVHDVLTRLLDTVGDGSGTTDMATTADIYYLTPPEGQIYIVENIFINILDDAALDIDGWGGIAALASGCKFNIFRGSSSARDLTAGAPLQDHLQLGRYAKLEIETDAGGCIVHAHFAIPTIRLDGDAGESLVFEVQDDLSSLVRQEVSVTGFLCQGKSSSPSA